MQNIVIDTNVIVSSLIQRSYPYRILYGLFVDDKISVCVSEELMSEYYEVLSRPKFARFPDFFARAERLLADIDTKAIKFQPSTSIDLITDKDDNSFWNLPRNLRRTSSLQEIPTILPFVISNEQQSLARKNTGKTTHRNNSNFSQKSPVHKIISRVQGFPISRAV